MSDPVPAGPAGTDDDEYEYDLFVAHVPADEEWVRGFLLTAFDTRGLRILTPDDFRPGVPVVDECVRGVQRSRATLLVLTGAFLADEWAAFIQDLATHVRVTGQAQPVIPVLREPLEKSLLPLELGLLVMVDLTDPTDSDLGPLLERLGRAEAPAETIPCPYPGGLRAFSAKDKDAFFGRAGEITDLASRLRQQRFITVIGPSGSGKSSLVLAGLLPRLDAGQWVSRILRPGPEPMRSLAAALEHPVLGAGDTEAAVSDLLARAGPGAPRLLLVVDQLEEAFTQAPADQREAFFDALVELKSGERSAVIVTVRADLFDELMTSSLWPVMPKETRVEVAPLRGEALRQAIVRPAERVGVYLEPTLVERLLDDAAAEPGSLPLVQETLVLLWEKRRRRLLALDDYLELGGEGRSGLAVALTTTADGALADLDEDQRELARRILLRLVALGEGRADTRRRRKAEELRNLADPGAVDAVVAHLRERRLLTLGADGDPHAVDLAHEALLSAWPTLRTWLEENRDGLRMAQELAEDARRWEEAGDESYLYRGVRLERATAWTDANPDEVGRPEASFVAAGLALAEETERRRRLAKDREVRAGIAAAADRVSGLLVGQNPVEGLVAAVQAVARNLDELPDELIGAVQASLLRAVRTSRERNLLLGHTATVTGVASGPDYIVSGSIDRTVRRWDLAGNPRGAPLTGHDDVVTAVAVSPDGATIVSAGADGTLRRWDQDGNSLGPPLTGHDDVVTAVSFSPDGATLASGSDDRTILLWDLDGNRLGPPLAGHDDVVTSVAFSPDGVHVLSGSADGTLRIWDCRQGSHDVLATGLPVAAAAFSPDGRSFAVGRADGNLFLHQRSGEIRTGPTLAHRNGVEALAYARDGRTIVTGGADGRARLWGDDGVADGSPLAGHRGVVTAVCVTGGGDLVLTGGSDGTVRVWDRRAVGDSIVLPGHDADVNRIVVPSARRSLVSGGADQKLRAWNWEGRALGVWEGHTSFVYDVAIAPDDAVVSASADGTVRLWDPQGKPIGGPFAGHRGNVEAVAFSPDGSTIASGGADRTIRLWDRLGQPLADPFAGHEEGVLSLAFSPDGGKLVSGGADRTVRLWDPAGTALCDPMRLHRDDVRVVAVSRDGLVASGSQDGTVRLWNLRGEPVGAPFVGHTAGVFDLAFSPDGRMVLTGSGDRTLRLWDLAGNQVGDPLEGHTGAVWCVAMSRDGRSFASGGADGTVRVWVGGGWADWLATACERLRHAVASTTVTDAGDPAVALATCLRHAPLATSTHRS